MKRYELKDKERQAAWEKAFPGFGDALQAACDEQLDDKFSYVRVRLICARILYCDGVLDIKKKAIRMKEGYDPNAWNNYPEVTPPEHVILRCEGHHLSGAKYYAALRYDAQEDFIHLNGNPIDRATTIERFRPWDEEEK